MSEELWRAVPEWEGLYEVSDQGRVRSLDRVVIAKDGRKRPMKGRIRKPRVIPRDGHLIVNLKANGVEKGRLVHRLVLHAFVGECPEAMVARHLNGIATDNRLENLAWGTRSENNFDQVRHGSHYEAKRTHCVNGHEFSGDNLAIRPNFNRSGSHRACRACECDATRRYQQRRRERAS